MPDKLRKNLLECCLAVASCLVISGCATSPDDRSVTLNKATPVPARAAEGGIIVGKSTKADVLAALGKTTSIHFDSGYEVWVYSLTREPSVQGDKGRAEFVVLFSPAGVVTKTRIRPVGAK